MWVSFNHTFRRYGMAIVEIRTRTIDTQDIPINRVFAWYYQYNVKQNDSICLPDVIFYGAGAVR